MSGPIDIKAEGAGGQRLDVFLSRAMPALSRSRLQALIREGAVLVAGQPAKPSLVLAGGELITLTLPKLQPAKLCAEDIALDIVYEDAHIVVVNKPQGMVVHPAAGHRAGTLVNALLNHCADLSGLNGESRPGIVHRLDKDTSGLLVVAKNDAAHLGLARQWQGHDITRIYHGVLNGVVAENAGLVDAPLGRHPKDRLKMAVNTVGGGRSAITHYRVLQRFAACTYAELRLETGRTHQIRVHMAYLGHAVAGDKLYGPKKQHTELAGQALHAKVLGFKHPISGKDLRFESDLPPYFAKLLEALL
ncbi:MAG: RluA family pseudouridine synthase [Clostridiales bacterium]|nr:RluA family pseudouridine synthase [Clostridiales bacterium]